jgi:hypothetical protein
MFRKLAFAATVGLVLALPGGGAQAAGSTPAITPQDIARLAPLMGDHQSHWRGRRHCHRVRCGWICHR